MNITSRYIILAGLCAAGFLAGFSGRRLSGNSTSAGQGGASETKSGKAGAEFTSGTRAKDHTPEASGLRSADTVETLAALDDAMLYGRLALWLLDASGEDIDAFWKFYGTRKNSDTAIQQLIFIQWTLRDPQAAMAAVTGTGYESSLWQAWAGQDPLAALAAALGKNQETVNSVAYGIGLFQPDWLRQHFDELPADAQQEALRGLAASEDAGNPLETLNFLKEHEHSPCRDIITDLFTALVAKDPWAAYDWMQENGHLFYQSMHDRSAAMDLFVKQLSASQPEALQRIAELTPSGEFKRKMEAALFKNLLESDPEAAFAQAKATKATAIAKVRLSAVGLSCVQTDPEKAFEIAENLLAVCPAPFISEIRTEHENSSASYSDSSESDVQPFFDAMIAKDPARLLEMCQAPSNQMINTFSRVADMWASSDLVSYTQWVNQQSDPQIRDEAGGIVVNHLFQVGQQAEALEWAATLSGSTSYLDNYFRSWRQTDPEQAAQWLESSNLPEDRKAKIIQDEKP